MSKQRSQESPETTAPEPPTEPEDSELSNERKAELLAAFLKNRADDEAPYAGVIFHTRGESLWVMREQGWTRIIPDYAQPALSNYGDIWQHMLASFIPLATTPGQSHRARQGHRMKWFRYSRVATPDASPRRSRASPALKRAIEHDHAASAPADVL